MKIHEALTAVMRAVPAVPKADRNEAQKFNFRGIDAVMSAVGPALREHGVVVYPFVAEHRSEMVAVGSRGTQMMSTVLLVEFGFIGPEGDKLVVRVPGQAYDSGDKSYAKAMSVALRTALLQTLALPTDERDPDADAYERAPEAPPKSPVELARELLLEKVIKLAMNPGDVAQMYLSEVGTPLQKETNPGRITDFAERLGAK